MSFMGLLSTAMRFEDNAPQARHRWMMAHSPFLRTQTATGSMTPPQWAARSPGSTSRCRLARQLGQWLRCAPPADLAGESVVAGMAFEVSFLVLLAFVRTVHVFLQKIERWLAHSSGGRENQSRRPPCRRTISSEWLMVRIQIISLFKVESIKTSPASAAPSPLCRQLPRCP